MKRTLKTLLTVVAAAMFLTLFNGTGTAQHLISSKAGFVNRTDGKVYIRRQGSEDDEKGRASLGTQMRNGDLLSTETAGFAEILLNPGAYLRLNENSEVRAINTSLMKVQFELVKGSVILEVGEVDKTSPLQLNTPHGQFFVKKDGLHRFDLLDGATLVAARQGEVWTGTREQVLANQGSKIGRGKQALISGQETPELAKISKEAIDDFDVWSFNRAQTLVAANNMALRQSRTVSALAYGWFFDPFNGTYTFIPRRGMFWSPYGFGYFNSYNGCFTCYGNPYGGYGWGWGGGQGGGGGVAPSTPARVISGLDRTPVRREIEGRRVEYSPSILDGGVSGGRGIDSGRAIAMPSTATVVASPAPARGDSGGGASSGGSRPSGPSRP